MKELPLYVCHKQVRAAKIERVKYYPSESAHGTAFMHLKLEGCGEVIFEPSEYHNKPVPEDGWYLVRYDNGYFSFSPAKAFEEGYTLAPNVT